MPIYHGTDLITGIRHGADLITEVRHGSDLVHTSSLTRYDFDLPDAPDLDPAYWADQGGPGGRTIGIQDGVARLLIDDVVVGGYFDLSWNRKRFIGGTAGHDDGYVEVKAATRGSSNSPLAMSEGGFNSHIYGRGSNAAYTDGVGIRMRAGHCWIVSRISSTVVVRGDTSADTAGGTFQAGDRLRLVYVGNLHTLFVNGTRIAKWTDSGGIAHFGGTYRSLLIDQAAGKDVGGPRRFSPAFDYVLMG